MALWLVNNKLLLTESMWDQACVCVYTLSNVSSRKSYVMLIVQLVFLSASFSSTVYLQFFQASGCVPTVTNTVVGVIVCLTAYFHMDCKHGKKPDSLLSHDHKDQLETCEARVFC